jgi:hypothetical protein
MVASKYGFLVASWLHARSPSPIPRCLKIKVYRQHKQRTRFVPLSIEMGLFTLDLGLLN